MKKRKSRDRWEGINYEVPLHPSRSWAGAVTRYLTRSSRHIPKRFCVHSENSVFYRDRLPPLSPQFIFFLIRCVWLLRYFTYVSLYRGIFTCSLVVVCVFQLKSRPLRIKNPEFSSRSVCLISCRFSYRGSAEREGGSAERKVENGIKLALNWCKLPWHG